MRIIAGIAKGMPLTAPRGAQVRPTADRIREAVFSSLGGRVDGADVLDLYAGTGALGLEAASRGARSVTFVENAGPALAAIRQNIEHFRRNRAVDCPLTVLRAAVEDQLEKLAREGRRFHLILADPPYGDTGQGLLANVSLPSLLMESGLWALETGRRDRLEITSPWQLARDAVYGDTRVSFLALEKDPAAAAAGTASP